MITRTGVKRSGVRWVIPAASESITSSENPNLWEGASDAD